jgi:hypothetical protein
MKKILFLSFAALLLAGGCNKNGEMPVKPELSAMPATIQATAAAGSYTLNVTATQAWSAEVNAAATWCAITPNFYAGIYATKVSVLENPLALQRAATITFTAGTLTCKATVAQAAAAATLSVDQTEIPATAAAGSYTIAVTSNVAWTATVNAAATWCAVSPASATGNSTVTVTAAENTAKTARTATVTVTAGTLNKNVTVSQAGKPDTPLYAASTQTWTFGDQIWSDAIQIPECNKTSFTDSYDVPHCRSYTTNNITYYYYNWAYVNTNGTTLCAAPWRVPSLSDFDALIGATSSGVLSTAWGLPGYANGSSMSYVGDYAYYWSATPNGSSNAYFLGYNSGNLYVSNTNRGRGFQVRCVR